MNCFGKKLTILGWIKYAIAYMISLSYGWMICFVIGYSTLKYGRGYFQVKKREDPPEILQNPDYGEHHTVRLGDVNIHYVAKGKSEAPLILMLHGFPDFWFSWKNQLIEFGKTHYAVAMDLRGYGESDKLPYLRSYEIPEILEDVDKLITHLGKNQAILIGHDWGGFIAAEYVKKYPDRVSKLILLNSSESRVMGQVMKTDLKQFLSSWYIFFFQLILLPELTFLGRDFGALENLYVGADKKPLLKGEELEAYKFTFSRPAATTCAINYYRANFDLSKSSKITSKISCPTMVVWGQDDTFLTLKVATGLTKLMENIKFEFLNAGHFVHLEKPKQVNKFIRSFIRK
ncbi:epoxide hydrolase 4-like [Brevipalpus obovatus]|uniref:epoxide hydrolase 4-like n=1 Tax=Brevipalpus obovatus TaxID=246614 RepID=UPI003D9EABA2